MNLSFERVFRNEEKKILKVYEIIRASGERMYIEQGLSHWRTPYPLESIKKDCEEKEVYLVKDVDENKYIHTFQLEFLNDLSTSDNEKKESKAIINKFATIPQAEGKGIGKLSINYIEDYCSKKGVSKISLDVYDKSEHAIKFYKKRGFIITGSKSTRHFSVYLMEKHL